MVLHGRGSDEGRIPEIQAVTGISNESRGKVSGMVFMGETRFLHRGTTRTPTFRLDRDREKGPEPAAFLLF